MIRVITCLLFCLVASPSFAYKWGSSAQGQLYLSLGSSDLPGAFINWMKSCGDFNFNTGSSPASLDANGYPNISPPGATIFRACALPTLAQYSGTWEIGWTGTGEYTIQGTGITVTSDPGACSKGSGKIAGTNCSVVFNFNSNPNITLQFNSGNTFTNMAGGYLVRSTDKTAYLAGQIWSPEFLTINRNLNAPLVRTMGMTFPQQLGMAENSSQWAYRTPITAMSYNGATWFPNLWSSSITGTDQYTAAGATDTPVSWTDREMLQGSFPNANSAGLDITGAANNGSGLVRLTVSSTTSLSTNQQVIVTNINGLQAPPTVWAVTVIDATHVDLQGSTYSASWNPNANTCASFSGACMFTTTINVANRGAKFILGSGIISPFTISSGAIGTLVYDASIAVLGTSPTTAVGAMIYTGGGGVNAGVPIEAQVNLANTLGIPLWFNIPPYYKPASTTSLASYVCTNALFTPFIEMNNESSWNYVFQAQWYVQRGFAWGLSLASGIAPNSAFGYDYRINMAAATSACPSIHRILGAQAYGSTSDFDNYEFKGQKLCGASCGNSLYQALVGTDYNSAPNRPLDYADYLTIATYFQGAQTVDNSGTLVQLTGSCNGTTCTGIIAAANCYAVPSDATCGTGGTAQAALNFVDSDTRNGKYTDGTGGTFTIGTLQSNIYPNWNTVAANDGKYLLAYEGGFSSQSHSASYLTSIGSANGAADATNINNLLIAYRSSSLFNATYQYQNQVWFSFSRVKGNANLQLEGSSNGTVPVNAQYWGLMTGTYLTNSFYQNYKASCTINKRSC